MMKRLKRIGTILMSLLIMTVMCFGYSYEAKAAGNLETMTALELTDAMRLGWNLGNTLDSTNVTWISNPTPTQYETAWGNPVTTKAMIDKVKEAGFNTIRIPVTWDTKIGSAPNYTIDSAWMDRVQEVVDYGIKNGMYVILNTHHETSWIIPKTQNQSTVSAKLESIWKQIAARFKNYDEHLIFETMNEPRITGDASEWTGGTSEARSVINAYNLAAVNAIRGTGGNNTYRFIMIPTHAASAVTAAVNDLVIPNNDKRCIVSLHMYSPYSFAMDINGTASWGSSTDKSSLESELDAVYNKFIKNGTAVVIGEFGSINKNNLSARVALAEHFAKSARNRKIPVIWWDNNVSTANKAETYGLLDRSNCTWTFPEIVTALVNGSGGKSATTTAKATLTPGGNVPTVVPTTAVSGQNSGTNSETNSETNSGASSSTVSGNTSSGTTAVAPTAAPTWKPTAAPAATAGNKKSSNRKRGFSGNFSWFFRNIFRR